MRDYPVRANVEHEFKPAAAGLCLKCGGNYDMLGHVLYRRRKAAKEAPRG
jgi:hypothetical protein